MEGVIVLLKNGGVFVLVRNSFKSMFSSLDTFLRFAAVKNELFHHVIHCT